MTLAHTRAGSKAQADRALTPLFHGHINPYGQFALDLNCLSLRLPDRCARLLSGQTATSLSRFGDTILLHLIAASLPLPQEAVDLWLERSYLASNPSAPLFPSFGKNRETIELRRLDRRSVLKLVEKRAKTSGILKRVCCHSFRATGVTEYMNSGGTIE